MGAVNWSVTAQQDIEDIGGYIAKDSPFYAVNFIERILQYTDRLGAFPESGRVVPEFNRANIRELIFHNYRIVYQVKDTHVFVVSVSHGSMDIVRKSKRENWEIG